MGFFNGLLAKLERIDRLQRREWAEFSAAFVALFWTFGAVAVALGMALSWAFSR